MEELVEFMRSFWVVWMMLLFLGIVAWALWPGRKAKWERAARIPLREDGEETAREGHPRRHRRGSSQQENK